MDDWLFESVAGSYGRRGIGVLLSGANRDGARGAALLARAGGSVVVQDPTSSAASSRAKSPAAPAHAHGWEGFSGVL